MEKKIKQKVGKDHETEIELQVGPEATQPEVTLVRSQSSVQIETDSKGAKKYSVKVYDDDPEVAAKKALELSEMIESKINGKGDE